MANTFIQYLACKPVSILKYLDNLSTFILKAVCKKRLVTHSNGHLNFSRIKSTFSI